MRMGRRTTFFFPTQLCLCVCLFRGGVTASTLFSGSDTLTYGRTHYCSTDWTANPELFDTTVHTGPTARRRPPNKSHIQYDDTLCLYIFLVFVPFCGHGAANRRGNPRLTALDFICSDTGCVLVQRL
ncbi:hypothetical protein EDB81DRAFT_258498 [Dactylonectria macrodidyma]|uniref:Secreted protein n=1 Tax=Dactylonectria macrodidyma TaxID=307937 RepID=A0A9P9FK28_9HYPO|nr:hypothetical protein EDB81DRAFT_258498 [Dactylonectria macrodidyma]